MKEALQTLCVVAISFGIIIEACYEAHMGFILITGGSLAFAISTKINKRKKK